MGLDVRLVNDFRATLDTVEDPKNLLHRLLPDETDETFVHANAIDWYGTTTFNYLQVPRFLQEWSRLEATASDPETRILLAAIRRLADQVSDTNRVYLVFRGD